MARQEQRRDQATGEVGLCVDAIDGRNADPAGAGGLEQGGGCRSGTGRQADRDELVVGLVDADRHTLSGRKPEGFRQLVRGENDAS